MAVPPADSPLWAEVLRALSEEPTALDRLLAEAVDRRRLRPDELTPAGAARVARVPR